MPSNQSLSNGTITGAFNTYTGLDLWESSPATDTAIKINSGWDSISQ
jgi:hypothetical protein